MKAHRSAIIMLFTLLALSAVVTLSNATLPVAAEGKELPSLAPMLDNVTPAVVNIATEGRVQLRQNPLFADPFFRQFFDIPDQPVVRKTQSLGSGVIVDAKRGLVLTNNHVIANAVQITVTLRDGRQLAAELEGTDPETDVAVIKIPAKNLVALKPADSDKLRVGDFVVAIGNPFGLGQTVTSGIISALSRSGLGIEGYEDFIQTDASINPGNSGGALVNLNGDLIGINTAIFSQSGGNIGIGFAIPINLALDIMEQLLRHGQVQRGILGIQVQDLNPDLAEAFGLKQQSGAVVNRVMEDSPADRAGVLPGDIITRMNGKTIKNAGDVRNQIGLLKVGDRISFDLMREGKTMTLAATIEQGKEGTIAPVTVNPRLEGMTVGEIKPEHPAYGKLQGVVIVDIQRNSPGWRSGLREGDVITSVNKKTVKSMKDFVALVDKNPNSLLFRIVRGNMAAFVVIK